MKNSFKIKTLLLLSFVFLLGVFCFVKTAQAKEEDFYVDSSYDIDSRDEIEAELIKITDSLYFYIDKIWWEDLSSSDKNEAREELSELGKEFEKTIYSTLTSEFGREWRPGVDNDSRVTVLFHPMKKNSGGYFNSGDEYPRLQNPSSNKKEMVYLNADYITNPKIESFLAHEFVHLITFNQKERIRGTEEEVWLNEARAEYAPTLCGYDQQYEGSNLQNRVKEFLNNPSDSITEWQGLPADYGVLNLFTQYLVDHYGVGILADSLHSSTKGIESINYALGKNGFKEDFSQIFTDWTIAVLVNDCSLGNKYCYKNENLDNLRIIPESNFLPLYVTQSSLSVYRDTKNWAGNWQKIFGGKGTLTFTFDGDNDVEFEIPYIVCKDEGKCSVKFLDLDENQESELTLEDFNREYLSLTIIPTIQSKFSGFENPEPEFSFSWNVKISEKTAEEIEAELIKQLLVRIAYLKAEIAKVKSQIAVILGKTTISCQRFDNNVYYGVMANSEVRCLQQFLKDQGVKIYPEGLVTGNFLSLTKAAVIRFQEKYASEVLAPLDLEEGTGYFGPLSRKVANGLIHR